jgi:hypothetical protein
MYTHCICLSRLRYNSPLYRLPTLPILPVNSFIFTILPVNLKHGKSSTLVSTLPGIGNVIATEYTLQNNNDVLISKAII